jgi:hypothetical protein
MVRGAGLGKQEHELLEQSQYVPGQIEGCMIRSVPQRMWSREAAESLRPCWKHKTFNRSLHRA